MKKVVQKIYKGCVEVPNHVAEEAIKKQEDLTIVFDGKSMKLKLHEILSKRKWVSREFGTDSKRPYRLWAYLWIPEEVTKKEEYGN